MKGTKYSKHSAFILAAFFVLVFFCTGASAAQAATIYSNSSTGNDSTGNGTSGSPYKTFNKAYTSANAGDTIDLTGTFSWSTESGNASTTGYTIAKNITIQGHGTEATIVEAGTSSTTASSRVFTISSGVTATITGLTIQNGRMTVGSDYGGGILNNGTLTLTHVDMVNNIDTADFGGALANVGTTTVMDSSFRYNTALYSGGAIINIANAAVLYVTNSTISHNLQTSSTGYINGGGIGIRYGTAIITNSTIMYNSSNGGAGGIYLDTSGGTGALTMENTIVADNLDNGGVTNAIDFSKYSSATMTDNGYNIVGYSSGYTFAATGDWTDQSRATNFTLYSIGTTGPLVNDSTEGVNDDPYDTYTLALQSGSIAINNATTTANSTISVPTTDQRGATRNGATDIGAFEYNGGLTVSAPTTQASSVTFVTALYNQMSLSWTSGNGSRRTVFMKATSSGTASPVNGTQYTASSIFGSGTQIGTSGWYAVYDGLGNSVNVTGLTQGTNYTVQVFEYNGISTGNETYDTATGTGNPATQETHAVTTIYTNASTGNDSTGNGTSGNPFKTFNKAYTTAQAGDTIDLTGTFSWSTESGNASTTGYTIAKDINLLGHGPANSIIEAGTSSTTASSRVFTINSGVNVTMTGLDIRNGYLSGASYAGAGIANSGTLSITNSNIDNNNDAGEEGGGIDNLYLLSLTNSTVFNNTSYEMGGGLLNDYYITAGGYMTLTNDTIYGNSLTSTSGYYDGGGVHFRGGSGTITNCTITGNYSYEGGGLGIDNDGAYYNGTVYVENTIISGNTAHGGSGWDPDEYVRSGTVVDNGYNIIGSTNGTWTATGDWVDTSDTGTYTLHIIGTTGKPYLGTAALNSNPNGTYTFGFTSASSIAINNATTTANGATSTVPTLDQRGASRSGAPDIGAYEYNGSFTDTTPPVVLLTEPVASSTISGTTTLAATATDNVAVAGVYFYIDGTQVGGEATSSGSSFSTSWNSTATSSGTHTAFVVAVDTSNNYATSTSVSFTTANTAPVITSIATSTTQTTATITWTTSEAATSTISYGTSTSYGSASSTSAFLTSQSVTLTGLTASTTYHYQISSTDAYGNTGTTTDATFTTLATPDTTPPIVSILAPAALSAVSGSSVPLMASSTDNVAVAGVTFYINGTKIGSELTSSTTLFSTTWNSTATSSGTYSVFAVSRDTSNNYATSTSISFYVSNSGPALSSVSASPTNTGAVITWTTDQLSSSIVNFGPTSAYGTSTPEADTLPRVTSHAVTLSGLRACTTYHYEAESNNSVSAMGASSDETFLTTGCTGNASVDATAQNAITTAAGGTVSQGDLILTIPTSFTASSTAATFEANQLDPTSFIAAAGTPSGVSMVGTDVFNLEALTDATTTLSAFTAPLTITLSYTPSDIVGIVETSLKIYRYDSPTWTALSNCSVNTTAHTVTCSTNNFSDFALFGNAQIPSTPPNNTTTDADSAGGGGSITQQVATLLSMGNTTEANTLMQEWPNLFPNATSTVTSSISATVSSSTALFIFTRNLERGSSGADVTALQNELIANATGSAAAALAKAGATGYFGTLTKAAVIEYQKAHDISPAVGYVGTLTRAAMSATH